MNKKYYIIFILTLLILSITFFYCDPDSDSGDSGDGGDAGDSGDSGDGGDPEPILIEDFDGDNGISHTEGENPSYPWVSGWETTYTGGLEKGPEIHYLGDNYGKWLRIMTDALSLPDVDFGIDDTGYTYVQYEFIAPAPGTLRFTQFQHGYDIDLNPIPPNGTFEFWLDFDLSSDDISDPTTPPTKAITNYGSFQDEEITISDPGIYRLTWKATKDFTGLTEDTIIIDNIYFEPDY
jgi:hypothetical protein